MSTSGRTEPVEPTATERAAPPEHVPLDQTTVPRYPGGRPALVPAPHLVVSVGDDAARVARDLLRDGDRHRPVSGATDLADVVDAELSTVVTGWRVLAIGPERDVQAVRAAALARGALDAEIVLVPTDAASDDAEEVRVRALFCGACHRRFEARAAIGEPVACPGCHAALAVARHHSRRHGAFLAEPTGRDVPA